MRKFYGRQSTTMDKKLMENIQIIKIQKKLNFLTKKTINLINVGRQLLTDFLIELLHAS